MGDGTFGRVLRVTKKTDKKTYAFKVQTMINTKLDHQASCSICGIGGYRSSNIGKNP
jgi:hypothetical protein